MDAYRNTLSFDEVEEYLSQVVEELPPELFGRLNGGVLLLPNVLLSKHSVGADLYTLGTYHHEPYGLGRYISIYYGSFEQVHGHESVPRQKKALRKVLLHELTHHLESLAGMHDLEAEDEAFLDRYRRENS